jgi:hypothetical protein
MSDNEHVAADNDLRQVVEGLVRTQFGASVTLGERTGLGGSNRSNVWRWSLQGAPVPAVIVKKASTEHEPYEPDKAIFGPAARLFSEWAALQLLTNLKADLAPCFYGGDRDAGVIILEDLGTAPTMDKLLLGDDPQAAESALINLAQTLGQMHALTAHSRADFDRLRTGLGPPIPPRPTADSAPLAQTEMAGLLNRVLEPLNFTVPDAIEDELKQLTRAWQQNQAFFVLVHADPCPDNILVYADTVKLLDFEFSRYGSALVDGTYWRTFFPTCWCCNRVPPKIAEQMEQVYRAELVKVLPSAQDDPLYYQAVTEAGLNWAISFLNWEGLDPLVDDDKWGIATIRQRILMRFDVVAGLCEQYGHYPAVGHMFRALAARLRQRWPEDVHSLPEYPAFQ